MFLYCPFLRNLSFSIDVFKIINEACSTFLISTLSLVFICLLISLPNSFYNRLFLTQTHHPFKIKKSPTSEEIEDLHVS